MHLFVGKMMAVSGVQRGGRTKDMFFQRHHVGVFDRKGQFNRGGTWGSSQDCPTGREGVAAIGFQSDGGDRQNGETTG
jgi:hypothetical protein